MAYVRIYYHRDPARIAPHVRYIATRPGSCGLHGLGPAFRELRGDVGASVDLLNQHAARARTATGLGTREGPFTRMFFTLPSDLAVRVDQAHAHLMDGPRLVLRDAIEATFRSAGRELQGVYAIHFHAERRAAHGHVHVDLSALDAHGRATFLTAEQRRRLREAWEREVGRALQRVEQRGAERPQPTRSLEDEHAPLRQPRRRPAATPALPFVAARLFGWSRAPLNDLLLRALVARATRRSARNRSLLAVRFTLGLPVPRVTVRARTPLVPRPLLRLPFTS